MWKINTRRRICCSMSTNSFDWTSPQQRPSQCPVWHGLRLGGQRQSFALSKYWHSAATLGSRAFIHSYNCNKLQHFTILTNLTQDCIHLTPHRRDATTRPGEKPTFGDWTNESSQITHGASCWLRKKNEQKSQHLQTTRNQPTCLFEMCIRWCVYMPPRGQSRAYCPIIDC